MKVKELLRKLTKLNKDKEINVEIEIYGIKIPLEINNLIEWYGWFDYKKEDPLNYTILLKGRS